MFRGERALKNELEVDKSTDVEEGDGVMES
jgi:hypothetical protein